MGAITPLISSSVAGPLGVIHLPRLWSKLLLSAAGKLPEGYDSCGKGFDQMVLDGLGLDRDQTVSYVTENKPSYPAFEKWIVDRVGKPDKQKVDALNDAIRGYNHRDEVRQGILSAAGLPADAQILDAVSLNNLDDWTELHASVTG